MKHSKQVQTVLDILQNEIDGDTRAALKKMTPDYTMTWMYQGKKKLFPSVAVTGATELDDAYVITGRRYDIKNIAEGKNVVMVELIESYPDPKTKKVYRTPLVLVLEFKGGKIRTGRHYCDPAVSYLHLTARQVAGAYKN
jgi:ketosteroid isomerase-like protein